MSNPSLSERLRALLDYEYHDNMGWWLIRNSKEILQALDDNEKLETALRDCIDSLEYVDAAHPGLQGLTGRGVRAERIAEAKKLLTPPSP